MLVPLSVAFRGLAGARAGLYRAGWIRAVKLPVPIVVVGNLTVGGTGKTPLVVWLAKRLAARGWSPGIVSRGYGGAAETWPQRVEPDSPPELVGDEPVLLAARSARPVFAGPDRVAAVQALIAGGGVDVVLSDDGLQHYRLARTFEIAVVDGARGLGNGWCLPAGPLREPPSRLGKVDAIVVNFGREAAEPSDASGFDWIDHVRTGGQRPHDERASPAAPATAPAASADAHAPATTPASAAASAPAATSASAPASTPAAAAAREKPNAYAMRLEVCSVFRITDGKAAQLADFAGRPVHAVAGIGHPERFFRTLEEAGLTVRRHPRSDHAPLSLADLPSGDGMPVLLTEKDAVKVRDIDREDVWCVVVEAIIEEPMGSELVDAIETKLRERKREQEPEAEQGPEQGQGAGASSSADAEKS